jgi:hypothetical protein
METTMALAETTDGREVRRTRRRRDFKVDKQEVVDRVMEFFEKDETDRSVEKSRRLQRYAKFRMWTEGKDWPWSDSSDVAMPDMMEKSLRMQDTIHNAVMSSRPVIGANAVQKSDSRKERFVDRLIDYQVFVEQQGEERIGELAEAFVNDGVAYVFLPWVSETRKVSDAERFDPIPPDLLPADYFRAILGRRFGQAEALAKGDGWDWDIMADGREVQVGFYTTRSGEVEMVRRERVTVYEGPRLIQKDWDEVLYPARAANLQPPGPSNPHGAAHVILVDYPTVDEIRALQASGVYNLLTEEDLNKLEVAADSSGDNQEMQEQKDTLQGTDGSHQPDKKRMGGHRTVTRLLCFDTMDVDGDGQAEDVVWWVIRETKALCRRKFMTEIFPADPPRRPIRHQSFMPVRGRVAGISLLEMMEGLHDVMKMALDQTVDAGTLANAPFGFYRPSGTMKPEIMRMSPGELYPMQDPQRDAFFPQFPNRDQTFGFNLVTMLNAFEERLTTVGDLQLGRVPQGKASALRTMGGMAMIQGQGEARPERILRRFFTLLSEVWQDIHGLNKHFMPQEKRIRVIGIKQAGEDPYQEIQKDDVSGAFIFDFKANVLNASKFAMQSAIEALMSTYVSELAVQMGIIDQEGIYRLFREFGFAHGQDPDQYLKAPNPEAMRPRIFAEEALSIIIAGGVPDGVPAEAGGAMEHFQKLQALMQEDSFGLLGEQHLIVFRGYLEELMEKAAQQQALMQQAAAAGAFQAAQGGGAPGAPVTTGPAAPQSAAPLGQGQLSDESLPGAGGGGAAANGVG